MESFESFLDTMPDFLKKSIAILGATLISVMASGTTLFSRDYTFGDSIETPAGDYVRIDLDGATPFMRTGAPIVPCLLVNVPLAMKADDIELETKAGTVRTSILSLPPDFARPPRFIGSGRPASDADDPDQEIYTSDRFYPSTDAELVSIQRSGEDAVAILRLYPVRVNPVTREMRTVSTLSVRLTSPSTPRPSIRKAYTPPSDASWRYLLITTNTFVEAFGPLASCKRSSGTEVHIVTVDDIYREYMGKDNPAKIRECIRDGYRNHGTEYVLLGGGIDAVPMRGAYGEVGLEHIDKAIPTDLYYACLDGTWDGNGNGIFGETEDGENGSPLDLFAEVHTGRTPANTPDEVTAFVNKTIRYMTAPHPHPSSALLAAEALGGNTDNGTSAPQGGVQLDTLVPILEAHDFDITWLDDRPGQRGRWNHEDILAALRGDPNVVAHVGHGSPTTCMRLTASQTSAIGNDFPFVFHSMACNVGEIDAPAETIAEAILNHRGGAAAAVLNTRFGWFDVISPWMYSGEFQTAFFENAITNGLSIGESISKARESLIGKVERGNVAERPYRWIYYCSTLFGDPQLSIQRPIGWHVTPPVDTSRTFIAAPTASPAPFEFEILNQNDGDHEWKVAVSGNYLKPSPAGGRLAPGANATVRLSFDPSAMPAPGIHSIEVRFTWSGPDNGHADFQLRCTLLEPPSTAPLDKGLTFEKTRAGLVSSQKELTIRNEDKQSPLVVTSIEIDGHDVSLTGTPIDLVCYDQLSSSFYDTTAERNARLEPIAKINAIGRLFAIEALPSRPDLLVGLGEDNRLYRFDSHTGGVLFETNAIPNGGKIWSGLAYDEKSGGLYASSTDGDSSSLYHIDTTTSVLTHLTDVPGRVIIAIAFDNRGTLYAIDTCSDHLLAVDPFSGSARVIGDRLSIDANYSQGLTADPRGEKLLWMSFSYDNASALRLIDPRTGEGSVITTYRKGQLIADKAPEMEVAARPPKTAFRIGSRLPLSIPPGESVTIPVEFIPPATGDFKSSVSLYAFDDRTEIARFALEGKATEKSAIPFAWLVDNRLPRDGSANDRDDDGDGFTNAEEWECGTDPNDAASRLHIGDVSTGPGQSITFSWCVTPGLTYALQRSDGLDAGGFATFGTRLATGPILSVTDTMTKSNRFYRIGIERDH